MADSQKFWEGVLLNRSPNKKDWRPLWVVLRGRYLYFFRDRNLFVNNLVGEIPLDASVDFKISKKDSQSFSLVQRVNKNEKKEQKFKCQTKVDREMWRGFITGISKGIIAQDLEWSSMLPGQKDDLIKFFRYLESGGLQSANRNMDRMSNCSSESASSSSFIDHQQENVEAVKPQRQLSRQTWYFEHIDREKGEQILTLGQLYGNLLVRPSITRKGNFVIQFRSCKDGGEFLFYNFLVEKMGSGYSLVINDIDIPKPVWEAAMNPKPTVFDVLDFFVMHVTRFISMSEPKPMATNDMNQLGIWGEYGSHSSGSAVSTLARSDAADRGRKVRFQSDNVNNAEAIDEGIGSDEFNLSNSSSQIINHKDPKPPQRLQRKFFPVTDSSDEDDKSIPPPPQAAAPPPPPPKHPDMSGVPLPPAPPSALPPSADSDSDDDVYDNSDNVSSVNSLTSALRNVKLKSTGSVSSDGPGNGSPTEDKAINGGSAHLNKASSYETSKGDPKIDFQAELRKKLSKHFIYETPEQFKASQRTTFCELP